MPGLPTLASVGESLRAVRDGRGLTLDQAAELSGISRSHLSRLESGERQPSVASLLALSAAFGVPVGVLFGETERATPLAISPPDQPRWESNGLRIAACGGYAGSSVIDALRVTVNPDRPSPARTRHAGEEWLYVLSGTLWLEYGNDTHTIEVGTAAHFNAEVPHRLRAEGSAAEVLLVAARPAVDLRNTH